MILDEKKIEREEVGS